MKYILSILCALLLGACDDYLDLVPEKDIETIESIFETRTNADLWLQGVYSTVIQVTNGQYHVNFLGADEFVGDGLIRNEYDGLKIAAGLQMSQDPYGNVWNKGLGYVNTLSLYESIRNINTFLENIDNVYNMQDGEKQQWKAEVKALKAFCYFELIKRYGPIVLVPKNLDVDIDISDMLQQRVHVDTCFKEVVRLLDEAAEVLFPGNEKESERAAYFDKESALALKARVLLYAASPLFNGNEFYSDFKGKNGEPLFSTEYDHEKWRIAAEAADEAAKVCEESGHHLYNEGVGQGSDLLNTMYNIEHSVLSQFDNPEAILEWKLANYFYLDLLPKFLSSDDHFNQNATGNLSPSMTMVELYYTENGLPIDMDNNWNMSNAYRMSREASSRYEGVVALNTDVLQLHLRREPRFYASIAADRTYWQRGPKGGYVDNNLLVEARKGERFGTTLDIISSTVSQNVNGYWLKKHTDSEQPTYAYSFNADIQSFPIIRLAEVYLMQAEAWNEYLSTPDQRVYEPLDKVRTRAGIPDVKTSWKSYSKNGDMVDNQAGMREIIRREIGIEFAFEGHRFWDLRRWKIAHEVLNEKQMGWNILGETAQVFYNNFNGPVVVDEKRKFTSPRDYLFPLEAEDVLISSLVQNPGW